MPFWLDQLIVTLDLINPSVYPFSLTSEHVKVMNEQVGTYSVTLILYLFIFFSL